MRSPASAPVLALTLGVGAMGHPGPADATPGDAARVVALVNSFRHTEGLATLRPFADLADDAQAYARQMAREGRLFLIRDLKAVMPTAVVIAHYASVADSAGRVQSLATASGPVRSQILGDYDYLGVGAVRDAQHRVFVSVLLAKLAP